MLSCLVRALYGDLPHEQLVQASFFSLLLCMIVGVYWMMRSLKDSVFATTVGLEYQPTAKMLSLVVVTVMLFFYNKLVDMVPRDQLFKVICCGYSGVFLATAFVLQSSTHGLYGSDGKALPASPDRLVGWVHYFAIESYGSLVVSLFWQYTNSQMNLKEAKAQYGLIVAGGQVGAISGCTLVVSSKTFGVAELYYFGGLLTLVRAASPSASRDARAAALARRPHSLHTCTHKRYVPLHSVGGRRVPLARRQHDAFRQPSEQIAPVVARVLSSALKSLRLADAADHRLLLPEALPAHRSPQLGARRGGEARGARLPRGTPPPLQTPVRARHLRRLGALRGDRHHPRLPDEGPRQGIAQFDGRLCLFHGPIWPGHEQRFAHLLCCWHLLRHPQSRLAPDADALPRDARRRHRARLLVAEHVGAILGHGYHQGPLLRAQQPFKGDALHGDDRLDQVQGQVVDRRLRRARLQGHGLGRDECLQEAGERAHALRLAHLACHRVRAAAGHVSAGEGLRAPQHYRTAHRNGRPLDRRRGPIAHGDRRAG